MTTAFIATKEKIKEAEEIIIKLKPKKYLFKRTFAVVLFCLAIPPLMLGVVVLPSFIKEVKIRSQQEPISVIKRLENIDRIGSGNLIDSLITPAFIIYILPILFSLEGR